MKGRMADAQSILKEIARVNKTELPAGVLVADNNVQFQEKGVPSEDTQLLTPRRKNHRTRNSSEQSMGGFSSLLMLLSPNLLKSTTLLWIVFFGNSFSYYGLVLLTTELSNGRSKCSLSQSHLKKTSDINYGDVFVTSVAGKVHCHISTFLLLILLRCSPPDFFEMKCLTISFYLLLLLAEFPGLLISAAIVDKLGRKLSMSSMFFLCCFFLLPLVVYQPAGLTTSLLFGARICITATFTIIYIYAPEVNYCFLPNNM